MFEFAQVGLGGLGCLRMEVARYLGNLGQGSLRPISASDPSRYLGRALSNASQAFGCRGRILVGSRFERAEQEGDLELDAHVPRSEPGLERAARVLGRERALACERDEQAEFELLPRAPTAPGSATSAARPRLQSLASYAQPPYAPAPGAQLARVPEHQTVRLMSRLTLGADATHGGLGNAAWPGDNRSSWTATRRRQTGLLHECSEG